MIGILAALGALLAGLYLALRDGLPWAAARRTGLIRRPGDRARTVSRAEDPERFDAMLDRRRKGMMTGLAVALAGLLFAAWQILSVAFMSGAPTAG
ncbi:hypothetical protein [Brevundimonas sp.]|uniref:hypothetical protein n=1 Tax=Brevundimonas sp. TaxID=1871086 RepID=UPI0035AE34AC